MSGLKVERTIIRDGRPCGEDSVPARDIRQMPIPKERRPLKHPNPAILERRPEDPEE